jgi:hypothetical protein
MSLKTYVVQIALFALCAAPAVAHADSWKCEYNGQVREITILRTSANPVPCRVL